MTATPIAISSAKIAAKTTVTAFAVALKSIARSNHPPTRLA
jgi:hypothetical protein